MEENLKQHYPFVNPPLPYAYDALEPFIDEKTMKLHHDAHLQTYVDNLNDIISKYPSLHNWSLEQLIIGNNQLPWEIQEGIRNNAGGVYNLSLIHIWDHSFLGILPAGGDHWTDLFCCYVENPLQKRNQDLVIILQGLVLLSPV